MSQKMDPSRTSFKSLFPPRALCLTILGKLFRFSFQGEVIFLAFSTEQNTTEYYFDTHTHPIQLRLTTLHQSFDSSTQLKQE